MLLLIIPSILYAAWPFRIPVAQLGLRTVQTYTHAPFKLHSPAVGLHPCLDPGRHNTYGIVYTMYMRDLQEHRNIDSMPIVKTMTLATFRPLTGGSVGDECNGENDKGENGHNL